MEVTELITAALRMKSQNAESAYQMSLLRHNLDRKTLSSQQLLEALPEVKLPHLGKNLDLRF